MKYAFMGLATLLGGFLGLSHSVQAQGSYVDDALLFSRQGPSGTARTLGLGGANGSLGGDYGAVGVNPAGLGLFTKSEASFTPGLGFGSSTSTPVANAASTGSRAGIDQSANSFHIASLGLVFANRRPDTDNSSDWRGGAFALGFTRQADFNQAFQYQNQTDDRHSFFQRLREPEGNAIPGTIGYMDALGRIANQATNERYTNFDGLAYGNFLTTILKTKRGNLDSLGTPVQRGQQPRTGPVTQNELVTSSGSLSQFDLAYGGNYRDKLYIGGGIGIVSLNRTRTTTFSESTSGAQDFNYQDYVKTTGTGFNARIGLIYRVVYAVRLGASIQTPTYIRMTDEYTTTLTANPKYLPANLATQNVLSIDPDTYSYSLTTPFRATGSATVLLGKYGFLTGDVEYVGYSQARLNVVDGQGSFSDENSAIRNAYNGTVNLRAGAEGRFDIFRARLGYARYGSPYAGSFVVDRAQNYYTAGLGMRTKTFFVDVAGVYLDYHDLYSPYQLAKGAGTATNGVAPSIDISQHRLTASITGGILF